MKRKIAAISESITNQDYFTEIELKKLFCEQLEQYKEVEEITSKTLALNGYNDMSVLIEIDEHLFEYYSKKFNYNK